MLAAKRTLLSPAKRNAILKVLIGLEVAGDLAELGVYRGGMTRLMAEVCPDRIVHAFDTFAGMPVEMYAVEDDRHKPGEFSSDGTLSYLADAPNVIPHVGVFPDSASELNKSRFAFVHLDADLYASTKAGLEWFWPRLVIGGVVALDDWQWEWCPGVDKAIGQFIAGRSDAETFESAPNQLMLLKKK